MSGLEVSVKTTCHCKIAVDGEKFAELLDRYTSRLRHMSVDDAQSLAAFELQKLITRDCKLDHDVHANGVRMEPDRLSTVPTPGSP